MADDILPLKASVRTVNVPTTSSPALDLAFASTRSLRAALRYPQSLIFSRAAYFLCTVLRFPHTVVCFPRSILLCPSRFLPRLQRAGDSSPNSPRCLSPSSGHRMGCLLDMGPSLSSPFATSSTLSATVIRHSFRR